MNLRAEHLGARADRPQESQLEMPASRRRSQEVSQAERASVLVGVLWCLALLFVIVIGVLHTARMDLTVTKHHEDRIQAHYLALAGIEKAKALIYQDALERSRSRSSHTRNLYDAPAQFRDIPFGRGQFTVFRRGSPAEGGRLMYGPSDEESRLNINQATLEDLAKIEGMTPDIMAAIVDWRDADNAANPGGAEADYYASLAPPRRPRNGPFQTVRELLMVRGVAPELLLGRDLRLNGLTDDLEGLEPFSVAAEDLGWAGMLTVHSSIRNVTTAGNERVNIQSADEAALTGIPGISADLAKAIIAYRNQNRFESIVDLLDVTPAQDPSAEAASRAVTPSGATTARPQVSTAPGGAPPGAQPPPRPSGPKLISPALLMEIADDITVGTDEELVGVLNVNSASVEALMCLPGVTREIAHAIVAFRESSGYLPNIAHLLNVPGINPDLLKQLAPRVSTRSETYRIRSEGRVNSSGVRQRIEEVVSINFDEARILEHRENDL